MSPALPRALLLAVPGIVLWAALGVARAEGPPAPAMQAGRPVPPAGTHDRRQSSQDPDPVTSDTLFWCQHLQQNFAVVTRADPPPPQAAEFARRGTEMCARGRVREGILWLRHAIVLLAAP
jgi:hypothetical protein